MRLNTKVFVDDFARELFIWPLANTYGYVLCLKYPRKSIYLFENEEMSLFFWADTEESHDQTLKHKINISKHERYMIFWENAFIS